MARFGRLPRSTSIGLIALALLAGLASYAGAQGVGIFSRSTCTALTAPVIGQSFCFDQTANALKFWNGTAWVTNATQAQVNVLDFGAKGDGVTDDTTAVQNAITAAAGGGSVAGGAVYFPAGIYKQTATWTMGAAVRLIGTGAGPGGNTTCGNNDNKASIIDHSFNGTSVSIVGVNGNVLAGVGPGVENLLFRQCAGTGVSAQGTAISVVKASDTFAPSWTRIRNVTFEVGAGKDDWTHGIVLDGSGAATGPTAGGGLRDTWIDNVRISSGANATDSINATAVANLFIADSEMNLANGTISVTGPNVGKQSAGVHFSHVQMQTMALDFVTTMKAVGGLWATLTTTANTNGASLIPMQLTNTPTVNCVNCLVFAGTLAATGAPSVWFQPEFTFKNATVGWRAGVAANFGTLDSQNLTFVTNGTNRGSFGATSGLFTAANGIRVTGTPGSFASGQIYADATNGLFIGSVAGSSNDLNLQTPTASASILRVPTGTAGTVFGGGGMQLGAPTSGDKGIGTLNVASSVLMNGVVALKSTGAPTCINNCGGTPSITGNDSAFNITLGTTLQNSFTVKFATTWAAAPACVAMQNGAPQATATVASVNTTATGITVNLVGAPSNGTVYSSLCQGVAGG